MRDFSRRYLHLLTNDFSSLNLTRINDEEEFFFKQIVDSVYPIENMSYIKELYTKSDYIVDVGFGGGFPLLPLASVLPDKNFIGLEARRKKADAVRVIARELGLSNVLTFHKRVEEVLFDRDTVVSFKAVGKIKDFLNKIYYNKNCHVVFFKGPNVDDLEGPVASYGPFELVFRESYRLEGTDGRTILVYRGRDVPRGTKKDLVKLTDL